MAKTNYRPRLKEAYQTRIVKNLMAKFNYKNIHQVPRLEKIVINVGAGEAIAEPKILEVITEDLMTITGQKPVITRAKGAVSAFKLKKGMPIGVKVTLRRDRMYEFLDRFLNFACPRIRDFRGFSPDSFDGRGNYNLGVSEQLIFPELDVAKVKKVFGMDITFVTSAKRDDEAMVLLEEFGMVFRASAQKRR
ncbi:MAG: 50S ribosomal protein L5 [candidate division WOR-3 bacterium]